MVSRNLERANENDGFKMTALEYSITLPQFKATKYYLRGGYKMQSANTSSSGRPCGYEIPDWPAETKSRQDSNPRGTAQIISLSFPEKIIGG